MNNWGMNDMLVVCAFRYALSRKSYLPHLFIKWMKENWDCFLIQTKELIKREIKEHSFMDEWNEVLSWDIPVEDPNIKEYVDYAKKKYYDCKTVRDKIYWERHFGSLAELNSRLGLKPDYDWSDEEKND